VAETAGGWDRLASPGRPILLNPNLMAAREPARAVTTHPAFCEVMARAWRERGREVLIGDSPAGAVRGLRRVWETTGAAEAAAAAGARLVSLEAEGSVVRPVTSRFLEEVRLTALVETAAVVSLPKLKTHFLTILTGALKNGLGLVPGLAKAEFHRRAPHPDDFAELLVDLAPVMRPAFTFVDGVVGLEGDGPASGEARNFGLVVAGANPAAIDVVLARICGFEPTEVPTVRLSLARGLAPPEPEIVLLGLRETDLVYDDVAAPGSLWLRHLPRPVLRLAGRQFVIRPVVREQACTGCRRCVESCPVGAARREGEIATIDAAKCIQCLCCYETCADEAVYLRPSRAARLYYGFRDLRRRWRDRRRGASF